MRHLLAGPILLIAGCSGGNGSNNTPVDVNAAAARAEEDIANYAAGTPTPLPRREALVAAPTPTPTVASAKTVVPGSAHDAADVVRHYYALIGERRYRDAWALWGDKGAASGSSAAAFAAGFDKYAEYHATVAAPGDVDAGAGQRYVTVPVHIDGMLKDGARGLAAAGTITLHRVAEGIDTPDPSDHEWRIAKADIAPSDAGAVSPPPTPLRSPAPQDPRDRPVHR